MVFIRITDWPSKVVIARGHAIEGDLKVRIIGKESYKVAYE